MGDDITSTSLINCYVGKLRLVRIEGYRDLLMQQFVGVYKEKPAWENVEIIDLTADQVSDQVGEIPDGIRIKPKKKKKKAKAVVSKAKELKKLPDASIKSRKPQGTPSKKPALRMVNRGKGNQSQAR